jgi:hypothetical protein
VSTNVICQICGIGVFRFVWWVRNYGSTPNFPCSPAFPSMQDDFEVDGEGVTCLSWNTTPLEKPMLVVGGMSKKVYIYVYGERTWDVRAFWCIP